MATTMQPCIFAKARGLPWPMSNNDAPVQSIKDTTSPTTGAKSPLQNISEATSKVEATSEKSQSSPSKRQRLETVSAPERTAPQVDRGKDRLTSLPNELLFNIVEQLDNPVDFASLASTCQQVYTTVKQNHPERVKLGEYEKIKYELREELGKPDVVACSEDPEIWHRGYNTLDLEFPYSDFVLSWCDAWRATHHRLAVSEIIPKKIIQHMEMIGKEQKLKWQEDWQAQLTSDGGILLHCRRTYSEVHFKGDQIHVNGVPREDKLFSMCNHTRGSDHPFAQNESNICCYLSRTNSVTVACKECNTSMSIQKVERSTGPGTAVWDLEVETYHDVGKFEIEDCDNKVWLKWLGGEPSPDTHTTSEHLAEVKSTQKRDYSIGAEAAWKINGKGSRKGSRVEEEREKTRTFF